MASTLVVEDGTIVSGADAYADVTFVDEYHAARGNTSWALLGETEKDVAIRNGTFYLDLKYGSRWRGIRVESDQSLDWPRMGAYDDDGYSIDSDIIPTRLKWATAEAALRASTEDMFPDSSNAENMTSHTIKLGPITESKSWGSGGGSTTAKLYREVHACVRTLVYSYDELARV